MVKGNLLKLKLSIRMGTKDDISDFKCGMNSISERTAGQNLKLIGYNSRRLHWVPLLSAKIRKLRLQLTQAHQNLTIEDWKTVARSEESWILLQHLDGMVRI